MLALNNAHNFNKHKQIINLITLLLLMNNLNNFSCSAYQVIEISSHDKTENAKLDFKTDSKILNKNFHFLQTTTNSGNTSSPSSTTVTIDTFTLIMIVAGSVVLIAIIVVIIICCCKKKPIEDENKIKENLADSSNKQVELKEASVDNKEKDKNEFNKEEKSKEKYASENKKESRYNSEKQNKYIDESEIRANVNKHMDKSATDRRFLDSTDRNFQDNNMQKSFDLEEHFKNNIDNLDEKDEKLHQFLVEPGSSNQKKLSPIDVRKYQENQMQLEKERENSHAIPDLISNFTDNNKEFFSDDSRVQNSIAESIDYKYFDHINEDNNNIMKLNKEREFPVKNSSLLESQKMNKNTNNNNNNKIDNKKYGNVNNKRDDDYDDNKNYYAERNLDNYNSNQYASAKSYRKEDDKDNRTGDRNQQNHHREQDEDVDFEEYEQEEEEEEEEEENEVDYEQDDKNKKNIESKNRVKIGPDGNISKKG